MKALLFLFILEVHSHYIYPTNINGNSAVLRFQWDEENEASFVNWNLELKKEGETVWQHSIHSRPVSFSLENLQEWKNYTFSVKSERELYFHNVIYTKHVLQSMETTFYTVPLDLSIKSATKLIDEKWAISVKIQLFNPDRFIWRLETKTFDEEQEYNPETIWKDIRQSEDYDYVTAHHEILLMRIRVRSKEDPFEEYFSQSRIIHFRQ